MHRIGERGDSQVRGVPKAVTLTHLLQVQPTSYLYNITKTVSYLNEDQSFLRSQVLNVETAGDLATASSFTVPDFALNANCSLNLAVPSSDQVYGDLDQVIFSGGGNLNFSRLETDLPSSGLTFANLGNLQNNGPLTVTPGQLLTLANFPCPPPGTQLPGIIQSIDTTIVVRDALGLVCLSGLFIVIELVGNPPQSPPPPPSGSGYHTTSGYYSTGSAWPAGTTGSGYGPPATARIAPKLRIAANGRLEERNGGDIVDKLVGTV